MARYIRKGSKGGWEPTPSSLDLFNNKQRSSAAVQSGTSIPENVTSPQTKQDGSSSLMQTLRRMSSGFNNVRRPSSNSISSDNPKFESGASGQRDKTHTTRNKLSFFAEQEQLASCIRHAADSTEQNTESWVSQLDKFVQTVKETPPPEETPPLDGVSLRVLQSIRDGLSKVDPPTCCMNHEHSEKCKLWTNGAVYLLLKKFTNGEQCSVANLLRNYPAVPDSEPSRHPLLGGNADDVSEIANVFVSHTWSTTFTVFVESLERHVADERNSLTPDTAYFWICGLIINEHAPPASQNFANAFLNGVKEIDEVVCVLESWRNPVPLTRVWCLWEIMGAIQHEKPFTILFTESEEQDVVSALQNQQAPEIVASLCKVDAEKAQASVAADKVMILKEIEKMTNGIFGVNEMILQPLRQWICNTCQKAIDSSRETLSDPVRYFGSMYNFGELLRLLGQYDKAEQTYLDLLEWGESILHGGSLADVRSGLGLVYTAQGKYKAAESMYLKAIPGFRSNDTSYAITKNNLALLYQKSGRLNEAETLYDEVLPIMIKELGATHRSTLTTVNNLGLVYKYQERYEKAEEVYLAVLSIRSVVLGEEDTDTVQSMNNLATLYLKQQRCEEALPLLTTALQLRQRVLGEMHPDTIQSLGNLATAYRDNGDLIRAECLNKEAVDRSRKILGNNHPETLLHLYLRVCICDELERYAEAIELCEEVLQREAEIGISQDRCSKLELLAQLYMNVDRAVDAIPVYLEVLQICDDQIGVRVRVTSNLANLYESQSRYEEAGRLHLEVVNLCKQTFGEENMNTIKAMAKLGVFHKKLFRYKAAEHWLTEALERCKQVSSEERQALALVISKHLDVVQGQSVMAFQIVDGVIRVFKPE